MKKISFFYRSEGTCKAMLRKGLVSQVTSVGHVVAYKLLLC